MRNLLVTTAALMALSTPAFADPSTPYSGSDRGPYVRADAGFSLNSEIEGLSLGDGSTFGAGLGYRLADWLRVEVEGRRISNDSFGLSIHGIPVMANAIVDIPLMRRVQPYVGAGAGWAWGEVDFVGDDDGFAYQGLAGVTVKLTEDVDLDIGYRRMWVEFENTGIDYEGDAATIGGRYSF